MSHSIKAQTIGVSAAVVMYATMAIKLSMTSDTIVWISVLMWLGLSAAIFYMAFTAFIYNNQSLTLQELLRLRVTNHAEYRISKPNTEYAEKLDPLLTDNNEHANNLSAQKQVATEETWLKKRFEHLVVEQQLFLKQGIKIQDIALQLNTNRTYISNYVNSNYGMSFPDYINSLRIEYAKEYMLKEPHTILSEIAKASGFPNASAFNNVFKKTTGITPKIWRATHSSKGIEAKESQMSYSKIK